MFMQIMYILQSLMKFVSSIMREMLFIAALKKNNICTQ